jgi:carotenoid cleavage dioxygenase-like enzyme
MERREFLKLTGAGVAAGTTGLGLVGCSSSEEPYKFWHEGNYPPVSEEVTEMKLEVEGSIPPELSGLYVRNGSNKHTGVGEHFFDGDGMLHGVRLQQGEALWYRNRYVDTPVYREETGGFGPPKLTDTTSAVSLIHHGGKLLSLGEFGYPYEIDPEDLSTIGVHTYMDKLQTNMTAHPKVDPVNGEMLFYGMNFVESGLTYMRANAAGELVQVETINTDAPTMMHDFSATENYVIFLQMPVAFSMFLAVTGDGLPFRWDDSVPTRFGVMPRNGTNADVKWFDINPCFIFHTMNAFEQGDEVVLDASRYDQLWVTDSHDFSHPAYFTRFTMNMKTGAVSESRMDDLPMEFPQLNRSTWTRPYRYGYSLSSPYANNEMSYGGATGFLRYDMQTGERVQHKLEPHYTAQEAFFVAAGKSEEEGYLLSYVYDARENLSDLWILDATNVAAGPIAKVKLPVRVPQGFHGEWVPDLSV